MITSTLVTATSITVPDVVFKSTDTGAAGGVEQSSAITTIALCNVYSPVSDEATGSVTVNIYFAKKTIGAQTSNLVVSNLVIPAGETVFFSDERIILDAGDEIYVGTSAASRLAVTVSSLPV
jgi:hypothetical protein